MSLKAFRRKSLGFVFKMKHIIKKSNVFGYWIPKENTDEMFEKIMEHLNKKSNIYVVDADLLHKEYHNESEDNLLESCPDKDKELLFRNIRKERYNAIRKEYDNKQKIIFVSRSLIVLNELVHKKKNISVLRNELQKNEEFEQFIKIHYPVIAYNREEVLYTKLDIDIIGKKSKN
jgi:hypothetical protein